MASQRVNEQLFTHYSEIRSLNFQKICMLSMRSLVYRMVLFHWANCLKDGKETNEDDMNTYPQISMSAGKVMVITFLQYTKCNLKSLCSSEKDCYWKQ